MQGGNDLILDLTNTYSASSRKVVCEGGKVPGLNQEMYIERLTFFLTCVMAKFFLHISSKAPLPPPDI